MTLLTRLFLLVAIAVLPTIGIQLFTEYRLRDGRVSELHQQMLTRVRLISALEDQLIDGTRQLLIALSRLPVIQTGDAAGCNDLLQQLTAQDNAYRTIGVLDMQGTSYCNGAGFQPRPLPPGTEPPYIRDAINSRGFVVGDFGIGRASGLPLLQLGYPVIVGGEIRAVIVAGINIQSVADTLQSKIPAGYELFLADRHGTVLLHLPDRGDWTGRQIPTIFAPYMNLPEDGTMEAVGADGVARIYGYDPIVKPPDGIFITVGLDKALALRGIDRASEQQLMLIGSGLLLALLAAWLGGRSFIHRPVDIIMQTAERWRQGDYAARTGLHDGQSEISQLGMAFDRMAETLQQSLRQKDMLLREIHHRVMNSLQMLSSVLNLKARRMDVGTVARQQLEMARDRVLAMGTVYKQLYRTEEFQSVDFGEFLRGLQLAMTEALFSPQKPQELIVEAVHCDLSIDDTIPLGLVVHELVSNAMKYAFPDNRPGRIEIRFTRDDEQQYRLEVADDGIGLPETVEPGVSGLGLKLIEILIKQVNGEVTIDRTPPGTRFIIRFGPRT